MSRVVNKDKPAPPSARVASFRPICSRPSPLMPLVFHLTTSSPSNTSFIHQETDQCWYSIVRHASFQSSTTIVSRDGHLVCTRSRSRWPGRKDVFSFPGRDPIGVMTFLKESGESRTEYVVLAIVFWRRS